MNVNASIVLAVIVTAFQSHAFGMGSGDPQRKLRQAINDGARAKFTFRVADSEGKAVSNATVSVGFAMLNKKSNRVVGGTDSNGVFVAESVAQWEVGARIGKPSFYDSTWGMFLAKDEQSVSNGRWLPWNPTIPVVLRKVRNPIPMYVKFVEAILPKGMPIGFDCMAGEFLPPVGKGKVADFNVRVEQDGVLTKDGAFTKRMVWQTACEGGGFVLLSPHANSAFRSEYHAPLDGYNDTVDFYEEYPPHSAVKPKIDPFGSGKYLVFRSRVTKDDEGNVIEAFHGKIYGPLEYGRNVYSQTDDESMIKFLYYFNPTSNDRNIEFDGKNNLFRPDWRSNLNWSRDP